MIIFMQKCTIIINCQHNAYLENHKNEHNWEKIREMPKSIMSNFWCIIDSTLIATTAGICLFMPCSKIFANYDNLCISLPL